MRAVEPRRQATCFFEADPEIRLASKLVAEGVGTLLLTMAVASSGLIAQRLSSDGQALGLSVASAVVIAGSLIGLICAFGAVSGGHFNPLITGLQWLAGERKSDCTAAYVVAQLIGRLVGAELASLVVGGSAPVSTSPTIGGGLIVGEALATAGLMIVVFGCARSGRAETGPFPVGAWLTAAIIVTPSGSYANPAVTLSSVVSLGSTHLSLLAAVSLAAAEMCGALLAFAIVTAAYPHPAGRHDKAIVALALAGAKNGNKED